MVLSVPCISLFNKIISFTDDKECSLQLFKSSHVEQSVGLSELHSFLLGNGESAIFLVRDLSDETPCVEHPIVLRGVQLSLLIVQLADIVKDLRSLEAFHRLVQTTLATWVGHCPVRERSSGCAFHFFGGLDDLACCQLLTIVRRK